MVGGRNRVKQEMQISGYPKLIQYLFLFYFLTKNINQACEQGGNKCPGARQEYLLLFRVGNFSANPLNPISSAPTERLGRDASPYRE